MNGKVIPQTLQLSRGRVLVCHHVCMSGVTLLGATCTSRDWHVKQPGRSLHGVNILFSEPQPQDSGTSIAGEKQHNDQAMPALVCHITQCCWWQILPHGHLSSRK